MGKKSGWRLPLHILLGLMLAAAVTGIAMWLWNTLVPDIFGWSRVGYWQMLGLLVLVRLLFGHAGHGLRMHGRHRHLHEAMHGMSREERREFIRRRMRALCEEEQPDGETEK